MSDFGSLIGGVSNSEDLSMSSLSKSALQSMLFFMTLKNFPGLPLTFRSQTWPHELEADNESLLPHRYRFCHGPRFSAYLATDK